MQAACTSGRLTATPFLCKFTHCWVQKEKEETDSPTPSGGSGNETPKGSKKGKEEKKSSGDKKVMKKEQAPGTPPASKAGASAKGDKPSKNPSTSKNNSKSGKNGGATKKDPKQPTPSQLAESSSVWKTVSPLAPVHLDSVLICSFSRIKQQNQEPPRPLVFGGSLLKILTPGSGGARLQNP